MEKVFGGVEAGGTKFVCAIGTESGDILAEERFPTTEPGETLNRTISFFRDSPYSLSGIGVGTFGPIDPDPGSPMYGFITSTPKPGWANVNFRGILSQELKVSVAFDTDVNAAALGEAAWGAAQGLHTFIYLTIGTGIGGGALVHGNLLHGMIHPEMGHIFLLHNKEVDPFPGNCPFHGDCFEGLASGPAMKKRWGVPAEVLAPDHPGWQLEAEYIASALTSYICTLSPQRIILGGGVMEQKTLFPLIRQRVLELLNGYIVTPIIEERIETYIVSPGLGKRAGVLGAVALAVRASKI